MEFKIEEAFEQIEEVIGKLEEESISLDEAFAAYQEGMKLLKLCDEKIDRVEKSVLAVNQEGELDEF